MQAAEFLGIIETAVAPKIKPVTKLGTVTVASPLQVQWDGETSDSGATWPAVDSYVPTVGDRVVALWHDNTWLITHTVNGSTYDTGWIAVSSTYVSGNSQSGTTSVTGRRVGNTCSILATCNSAKTFTGGNVTNTDMLQITDARFIPSTMTNPPTGVTTMQQGLWAGPAGQGTWGSIYPNGIIDLNATSSAVAVGDVLSWSGTYLV